MLTLSNPSQYTTAVMVSFAHEARSSETKNVTDGGTTIRVCDERNATPRERKVADDDDDDDETELSSERTTSPPPAAAAASNAAWMAAVSRRTVSCRHYRGRTTATAERLCTTKHLCRA